MVNKLTKELKIDALILQNSLTFRDRVGFLKHRLKKYGMLRLCDELMFQFYYRIFLKKWDAELAKKYFPQEYLEGAIDIDKSIPVFKVDTINCARAKSLLQKLGPDIVFMQSREMIDEDILNVAKMGFIGCHPGILPDYRGTYAPFWTALNLELNKLGFTIYIADKGIDTGKIIFQKNIELDATKGTFKLHSEYIMYRSIPFIISTLKKISEEGISFLERPISKSRLFSHVGLLDYICAKKKLKKLVMHEKR
ncbi:MAG: hypothetical protein JSV30_06735 [Candidatus Omnitrophota bacterium]|nr:MAG: hypothetical protein JSV30_06735 [Candidatus Omnitrophota bacterium]